MRTVPSGGQASSTYDGMFEQQYPRIVLSFPTP